jgi:hypothetical protein
MNEFFTMRLANAVGVTVPAVDRLYVPAPVYLIERFDRVSAAGEGATQRTHIIDTCQLLNKSRAFKYQQANLETLSEAIQMCRQKASARIHLYRWLLINVLIGNRTSKGVKTRPKCDPNYGLQSQLVDVRNQVNEFQKLHSDYRMGLLYP